MQNKQYDNNFNNVIMKKINYLAMLLAAGMFAACSDTLEDATGGNNTNTPATGEGYVKVAINMPTTSGTSTRSTDNDDAGGAVVDLEDGEANEYVNEYNVENAMLVFFKDNKSGDSKDQAPTAPDTNAKFVKAYPIAKGNLTVSGSTEIPQVTEQVSIITEAPKVSATEQLYVLVILNYNSDLISSTNGGLSVNGTALTAGTSTLPALQSKLSGTNVDLNAFIGDGTTKNQFTMTNSPLSDKQGTSSTIAGAKAYTLVPVTVYDDQGDAVAGDVAKVYVERVVAKVTLTSTSTHKDANDAKKIKVTDATGTETGDLIEITGWCLNVTNNSTKLVRDVKNFNATASNSWLSTASNNGNSAARFAGTRPIENASFGVTGETNYYRIYWAQDANYYGSGSEDVTGQNEFTTYTTDKDGNITPTGITWNTNLVTTTADNACYCLENTMNYDQQAKEQTTGVLIKTNYWTKFDGETAASKKSFFICGTNSTKYPEKTVGGGSTSNGTDAFVDYVISAANELLDTSDDLSTTEDSKGISLKTDLNSGTYTDVTDVFTFTETSGSDKYNAQVAAVASVVGGRISYYKDGENFYYSSLIRHFQDSEGVGLEEEGVEDESSYQLKHLGRYGVVRNNWYEIDIQSVSGPGDPTIEEPEGPDDSAEGYINCAINVLSWAKRSQSVDL